MENVLTKNMKLHIQCDICSKETVNILFKSLDVEVKNDNKIKQEIS